MEALEAELLKISKEGEKLIDKIAGFEKQKESLEKRAESLENRIKEQYIAQNTAKMSVETAEAGIEQIADGLNKALWPDMHTTVLLETMAGKGSEVGRSFEELKEIIDRVELNDKLGVCFDTCHTSSAGYRQSK